MLFVLATMLLSGSVPGPAEGTQDPEVRGEVDLPRGSGGPIVVSSNCDLWIGARHGHLWTSRDGGRSWVEIDTPARKGQGRSGYGGDDLALIRFFGPQTCILATPQRNDGGGLFRTGDGGQTWNAVELPVHLHPYDVQVDSVGRGWIVGSSGDLLISVDRGLSWSKANSPFDQAARSYRVYFADELIGAVSSLGNRLAVTTDGAQHWTYLATPADQFGVHEEFDEGYNVRIGGDPRIDHLRIHGNLLTVRQSITANRNDVFYRPLGGDSEWTRVRADGIDVIDFETVGDQLAVITRDHRLILLDATMSPVQVLSEQLAVVPRFGVISGGLSVGCDKLYVFDGRERFLVVEDDEPREMRLETVGKHARWNIIGIDRAKNGCLWGITDHALYTSTDRARTWDRVAPLPTGPDNVLVQDDGNILLWSGTTHWRGSTYRWIEAERRFVTVPAFTDIWIRGILRRGPLWLAYGSRIHDRKVAMREMSTSHSRWAGDWLTGEILASTDGGATWTVLHEAPGGRVEDIFLCDDDILSICVASLGVRRGPLILDQKTARWEPTLLSDDSPARRDASLIYFSSPDDGRIWAHRGWQSTEDGGRTWTEPNSEGHQFHEYVRLGGGAWLDIRYDYTFVEKKIEWSTAVSVLRNDRFQHLRSFEGRYGALVDAGGGLLVDLPDGSLWRLSEDAEEWTLLNR